MTTTATKTTTNWTKGAPISLGGLREKYELHRTIDGVEYNAVGFFNKTGDLTNVFEIKKAEAMTGDLNLDWGVDHSGDDSNPDDGE